DPSERGAVGLHHDRHRLLAAPPHPGVDVDLILADARIAHEPSLEGEGHLEHAVIRVAEDADPATWPHPAAGTVVVALRAFRGRNVDGVRAADQHGALYQLLVHDVRGIAERTFWREFHDDPATGWGYVGGDERNPFATNRDRFEFPHQALDLGGVGATR